MGITYPFSEPVQIYGSGITTFHTKALYEVIALVIPKTLQTFKKKKSALRVVQN